MLWVELQVAAHHSTQTWLTRTERSQNVQWESACNERQRCNPSATSPVILTEINTALQLQGAALLTLFGVLADSALLQTKLLPTQQAVKSSIQKLSSSLMVCTLSLTAAGMTQPRPSLQALSLMLLLLLLLSVLPLSCCSDSCK